MALVTSEIMLADKNSGSYALRPSHLLNQFDPDQRCAATGGSWPQVKLLSAQMRVRQIIFSMTSGPIGPVRVGKVSVARLGRRECCCTHVHMSCCRGGNTVRLFI